jgi:hypothetical protein
MVVSPNPILDTGLALWRSKALLAALDLGLFTALADGPLSAEQLRRRLGLHPRAMPDLADALLAMGLLERSGQGAGATYANTPAAEACLDRREPGYLGNWLAWADARCAAAWSGLAEALRTGAPPPRQAGGGTAALESLAAMEATDALVAPCLKALADGIDARAFETLLDLGGDGGLRACTVAARHPHLHGRTLDRPAATRLAAGRIGRAGLGARLTAEVSDPLTDGWPAADLITLGSLLAEQDLPGKRALLTKAWRALPATGALIVVDHLIDDERRSDSLGLLMSLNRLLSAGEGFHYSAADFSGWASEAGFVRTQRLPLQGPLGALMAWKAG